VGGEEEMTILDFGSGTTCRNDPKIIDAMIGALHDVDSGEHEVVIKWQLFRQETVPACLPLTPEAFAHAVNIADDYGYETTASVFDDWGIAELDHYDVPFIKIACREWCYPLIAKLDSTTPVVVSVPDLATADRLKCVHDNLSFLFCVPEYPATAVEYRRRFGALLELGISDHCPDTHLWLEYEPKYYERHYKLPDSTGLDSGVFASTPDDLRWIL
jgi:sialic acid synthase SpsE